jgi:hypothetical protein
MKRLLLAGTASCLVLAASATATTIPPRQEASPSKSAAESLKYRELPLLRKPLLGTMVSCHAAKPSGQRCRLAVKQINGECVIEAVVVRAPSGRVSYPWVLERDCEVVRPVEPTS